MHMKFAAALAALLMAAATAGAAEPSAERGKALYMKVGCWQCHGTMGQGGSMGLKLAPEPLPYEAFTAFVRSTSGEMPPYVESILPEADLRDIHAYLETIPAPPDAKSIPLLQQ